MATKQSTVKAAPVATKNSEVFQSAPAKAKAEIAREIFNSAIGSSSRKEILARFQDEAKLTTAGAATYYQNMKKEAGMVAERGTRTPAAMPIGSKAAGGKGHSASAVK
jgi:hypothetical protein